MSEGLSRRRGRGGLTVDGDDGGASGSASNGSTAGPSTPKPDSATLRKAAAGPALASGSGVTAANGSTSSSSTSTKQHKVGYDPKDLEERSEEAEMPKLTLMEDILLLGRCSHQCSRRSVGSRQISVNV